MGYKIERERYAIIRKTPFRTEILCGHNNDAKFLPLDLTRGTIIRTYESRKEAAYIIKRYWAGYDNAEYKPVKVIESYEIAER